MVKFKILEIDVSKERVSLGIKQLTENKSKSDKFVNKIVTGIIEKIENDKILVTFNNEAKRIYQKNPILPKLKQNRTHPGLRMVKK